MTEDDFKPWSPPPKETTPPLLTRDLMRDPGRCKNGAAWLIVPDDNWRTDDPRSWACDDHYVAVCRFGEKIWPVKAGFLRCKYRFKKGEPRR